CYDLCAACIVGVNELEEILGLNLYPNPTVGVLNVSIENASSVKAIEMLNGLGQVVVSEMLNQKGSFVQQMNISDLASGLYTLRLKTTEGDVSKLIIKK
ncbi:MAG: T9SS type A sorting domain-containing protein, partial [Flavobacteriales bacterium]